MPTGRRSRRSSSVRAPRRKTSWEQNLFTHVKLVAGSQSITDISHQMIQNLTEPTGTCLRIVGSTNYQTDAAFGTSQHSNVTYGVCVVTADALAGGAVPDPHLDLNQGWYVWDSWSGLLSGNGEQWTRYFDIRTSRALRGGYRLAFVSNNTIMEVEADLHMRFRCLWSMPKESSEATP